MAIDWNKAEQFLLLELQSKEFEKRINSEFFFAAQSLVGQTIVDVKLVDNKTEFILSNGERIYGQYIPHQRR